MKNSDFRYRYSKNFMLRLLIFNAKEFSKFPKINVFVMDTMCLVMGILVKNHYLKKTTYPNRYDLW